MVVSGEDVRGALREVRPSAMREVTVEVPKVREEYSSFSRLFSWCVCVCGYRCCGLI